VYCDYILNSLLSLVVLIMYLRYHISDLTVIGMFKATLIGTLYTEFAREHEYYMYYTN
jgi:ABC-type phosphate/phosphonate transport system permease subunit